ncbi:MAG: AMP-binding protein [Candidatus Helarchaeota archaeon]|nr:AMP-binding protein [Candidatus Helarchaeota archaeon]
MTDDENFDFNWLDLVNTENESPWVRPDRPWLKNRYKEVAKTINYPNLPGFHSFLKRSAEYYPNVVLMHFPQTNEKYTLYETAYNADILSNAFVKEFGIKKGDGIAIMTSNCPEFVFTTYASGQTGGTLIPVNPLLKKKEVKHIVDSAGIVKVFITNKQYHGIVKRACKEANVENIIRITSDKPDELSVQKLLAEYPPEAPKVKIDVNEDVAGLLFTGGTTGLPKGVMITHSNLISNCFQFFYNSFEKGSSYEEALETIGNNRTVTVNPLCHAMGFYILNLCVAGATTLIIFTSFDAGGVLRMLEKYKITGFTTVPTAYNFIINHPDFKTRDLSALELCGSGSAPLPYKIAKVWEERTGLKVANAYGLTEVTCYCHGVVDWMEMNPQSIGCPVIDTDAKIVEPPDYLTELKPGERGELLIRGPQVMKGYWKNPDATKNVLIEDENGNLWLRTGDVAVMDENGYFFIVGRTKEQIKYKGYRVLPAEVEDGLFEHPSVLDCGVIGLPDELAGETIKAFIKLKPDYVGKITEEEIIAWAKENMAGYKWPRMVEFVGMIPKTPVGKTMRRVLLEKELKKLKEA